MAKQKGALCTVLPAKMREEDDVQVSPCQGWVDPCEFCDKRFGNWLEVNEEGVLDKIPSKPGIFMIALRNKAQTEVVSITIDKANIQGPALNDVDDVKDRVADKKSKATKSVVLCRWMTFKSTEDKDVTSLLAHWYNNGVLPKFLQSWPGQDILDKSQNVIFSDKLQKWCHPKKDAYWKKPKSLPSKLVEVIEGCSWTKPCEVCDENFGKWRNLDGVVHKDDTPYSCGIYMLSVLYGKEREVVDICLEQQIRTALEKNYKSLGYVLKNKKFTNKDASMQVRWLEVKDADSDNCCYLYAHWHNAERVPLMTFKLPGLSSLEKNKHFVFRTTDKKWCYEIEAFKQMKITKHRNKKAIMSDLADDIRQLNCEEADGDSDA